MSWLQSMRHKRSKMGAPSEGKMLSPSDPQPRWNPLSLHLSDGSYVEARDDWYSDRIRCDHPGCSDGESLGRELVRAAWSQGRTKVVTLVPRSLRRGLEAAGLWEEANIPGLYAGEEDCVVFGRALTPERTTLANPREVARVDAELNSAGRIDAPLCGEGVGIPADTSHAEGIAGLLDHAFARYPTPSGCSDYIAEQISSGIPFRVVVQEDIVVACASADLVPEARTAELTDCATRHDQRGRGLMTGILVALLEDLRTKGYPTAFTLARAKVPGVNLVFQKLGFVWRGRMVRSCRIGEGIEDMNVWSRRL